MLASLALFRAGKLPHELALAAVVVVVGLVGVLVYNGMKGMLEMYQNYPVRDLPDYREQYWGDAFAELLRIKRHYDPDGFFRFEQSITAPPPRA